HRPRNGPCGKRTDRRDRHRQHLGIDFPQSRSLKPAPSPHLNRRAIVTLPVLIVGAGPVGMTLASELTRYGVPVRIVDKSAQRTDKSKALVVWSRTLELLERA